jgi:hypothetical protein
MATTTPNYGWTVPTSTDLVKDGATAIETLGDAIDASMNTALGTKKAGMVLLNTTSFSGVASVSIPTDTFTSTYDNYRVDIVLSSINGDYYPQFRLRTSGTDYSGSTYYFSYVGLDTAGATRNDYGSATNYFLLHQTDGGNTTSKYVSRIELYKPKLAVETSMMLTAQAILTTGTPYSWQGAGMITATNSFDSLTWLGNGATGSGTIYTYGYSK